MTDGLVLEPGTGQLIGNSGMKLKIGAEQSPRWSVFEAVIPPGFDVGAHLHYAAEELFYILDGELDLLAFEPRLRTEGDWQLWESADGRKVARGGPGSLMFVPSACPHAFANPGTTPARLLLHVAPSGHEDYLDEVAGLMSAGGVPDPDALRELRARHDLHQLTPMRIGS
ncbi:cupin domain-containing protein [Streptomyces mesophilus]|uniref:cupin domain-containing protein n=1 Tax=Streptomyces mesophilus TaxID=1775132 RepID=UPI0033342538